MTFEDSYIRFETSNFPKKVTVFLGVHSSGKVFGLKFLGPDPAKDEKGTMDGKGNKKLVVQKVIPELIRINGGSLDGMWWSQDGATCHTTEGIIKYLESKFGNRIFSNKSRRGKRWPPRSPDLNVLGLFLNILTVCMVLLILFDTV